MFFTSENKCCSNILIESKSPHSSIQSDIWGKYSISNQTYKDNRDGVTTYLNNANGIPLFGGKGRKNINWQVQLIKVYTTNYILVVTPFSNLTVITFQFNFES